MDELKIRDAQKLQSEAVLVMQGGGSLGAYECGVYKTLATPIPVEAVVRVHQHHHRHSDQEQQELSVPQKKAQRVPLLQMQRTQLVAPITALVNRAVARVRTLPQLLPQDRENHKAKMKLLF